MPFMNFEIVFKLAFGIEAPFVEVVGIFPRIRESSIVSHSEVQDACSVQRGVAASNRPRNSDSQARVGKNR